MTQEEKTVDDTTMALIKEVQNRKAEIASAEKPNWQTNCSFTFSFKDRYNLHVADLRTLLTIATFLKTNSKNYDEVAKEMGVNNPPEFQWDGYPVSEWLTDIKTRINKIQISSKKESLAKLEDRLNSIISPELKRKLELEAIQEELSKT